MSTARTFSNPRRRNSATVWPPMKPPPPGTTTKPSFSSSSPTSLPLSSWFRRSHCTRLDCPTDGRGKVELAPLDNRMPLPALAESLREGAVLRQDGQRPDRGRAGRPRERRDDAPPTAALELVGDDDRSIELDRPPVDDAVPQVDGCAK